MADYLENLLLGWDYLDKTTAVIYGNTKPIDVIFNQSTHRDNKVYGGYSPDNDAIIYAKTSDLVNPKALKGKAVTIDSNSYRVVSVNYGKYITHIVVNSPDKK